jgi:hypothetical protein
MCRIIKTKFSQVYARDQELGKKNRGKEIVNDIQTESFKGEEFGGIQQGFKSRGAFSRVTK